MARGNKDTIVNGKSGASKVKLRVKCPSAAKRADKQRADRPRRTSSKAALQVTMPSRRLQAPATRKTDTSTLHPPPSTTTTTTTSSLMVADRKPSPSSAPPFTLSCCHPRPPSTTCHPHPPLLHLALLASHLRYSTAT
ncbi:hypothetical protein E2C01_080499 [Portunus trituberculatus]|uniref:Uncharacterized protein n=1 Tax=Portunus trituberculatus TaxID=210409 RepID=A0A5B7IPE4_PORTR|nr:hypothetical protein [Portunus trituberculatus]